MSEWMNEWIEILKKNQTVFVGFQLLFLTFSIIVTNFHGFSTCSLA